jgi:hypothetical protein
MCGFQTCCYVRLTAYWLVFTYVLTTFQCPTLCVHIPWQQKRLTGSATVWWVLSWTTPSLPNFDHFSLLRPLGCLMSVWKIFNYPYHSSVSGLSDRWRNCVVTLETWLLKGLGHLPRWHGHIILIPINKWFPLPLNKKIWAAPWKLRASPFPLNTQSLFHFFQYHLFPTITKVKGTRE